MSSDRSNFSTFDRNIHRIQVENSAFLKSEGIGTVKINTTVFGFVNNVTLLKVLYAPYLLYKLL